jgi:hypothetical protein
VPAIQGQSAPAELPVVFREDFEQESSLLAWGNTDGSVITCNLPQIRERLATVGLDW